MQKVWLANQVASLQSFNSYIQSTDMNYRVVIGIKKSETIPTLVQLSEELKAKTEVNTQIQMTWKNYGTNSEKHNINISSS